MSTITQLPAHARVWIYAAERALNSAEAALALEKSQAFVQQWAAHGHQLLADAKLLHDRFLVLMVDEQQAGASGCSIDSSVHFVQQLGAQLDIDFFNRMVFHYRDAAGEVQSLSRPAFKQAYADGTITDDATVFDPLVKNVGELNSIFEKPLAQSWHSRMV